MGRIRVIAFIVLIQIVFFGNVKVQTAAVGDIERQVVQGQSNDLTEKISNLGEKVESMKDAQAEIGLKINAMKTQSAEKKRERQLQLNALQAAQVIAHEAMQARFEAVEASGRAKIEALQSARENAKERTQKQLAELEELLAQNRVLGDQLAKFMKPYASATGGSDEASDSGPILQADITGGVAYTRWGRTVCAGDADLVYEGYAAVSFTTSVGGGSNPICTFRDPILTENIMDINKDSVRGIEYNFVNVPFITGANCDQIFTGGDMPCAVCKVTTRSHQLMIPGIYECPMGWTLEYWGYLVSSLIGQTKTDYTCLDNSPESGRNGLPDAVSRYVYPVEVVCGGSLPCPPYLNGYGIPCSVCSK